LNQLCLQKNLLLTCNAPLKLIPLETLHALFAVPDFPVETLTITPASSTSLSVAWTPHKPLTGVTIFKVLTREAGESKVVDQQDEVTSERTFIKNLQVSLHEHLHVKSDSGPLYVLLIPTSFLVLVLQQCYGKNYLSSTLGSL